MVFEGRDIIKSTVTVQHEALIQKKDPNPNSRHSETVKVGSTQSE